jgi:hypothetical protein
MDIILTHAPLVNTRPARRSAEIPYSQILPGFLLPSLGISECPMIGKKTKKTPRVSQATPCRSLLTTLASLADTRSQCRSRPHNQYQLHY